MQSLFYNALSWFQSMLLNYITSSDALEIDWKSVQIVFAVFSVFCSIVIATRWSFSSIATAHFRKLKERVKDYSIVNRSFPKHHNFNGNFYIRMRCPWANKITLCTWLNIIITVLEARCNITAILVFIYTKCFIW